MIKASSHCLRHANPRWLSTFALFGFAAITSAGCVPGEEPDSPPTIVIIDEEEDEMLPPVCGDGVVEGDEVCDDGVNDASGGSCLADCSAEVTSTCGNGVLDEGEHCDGDEGMVSCSALGFDGGGTSRCTPACTLDVTTCAGVRRLPFVQGSPRGVSTDNRYAIYAECDATPCHAATGEPGAVHLLDLVGGEVISHGEDLSTISMSAIDAERFWIIANWNRDEHFGQLQKRRFDGRGEPVVVADRVSIEQFDGTHPTHVSYLDVDGTAWVVRHGDVTPEKVFVPEGWISSFTLGHDGTTALVGANDAVSWLDLEGGRIDFDGEVAATSPDGRWAVVSSWSATEHHLISMTDGSILQSQSRRLESAQFSASSKYVYIREEACSSLSRTRVLSLPDGRETSFGECARYQPHGLAPVTADDRWLMQPRWLDSEQRHELLFTDLDTRETTTIPYRFVSEDQQLPLYAYEPTSEQLVFTGVHTDGEGATAHRLDLATGEFHPLPERFEGARAHEGGWLIGIRVDDPDTWTWDRYFLKPNGTQDLIVRRSDWLEPIATVPGLYLVRRADDPGFWYARRGQSTLEPLAAESGWNVTTYGPYLIWQGSGSTWLTVPN